MKIGIPRGLYFFYHYDFWEDFFSNLDCEIITSHPTTQKTLEVGSKLAPSEICLPVKAFLGHIKELAGKCDKIFIQRLVCCYLNGTPFYGCPKTIGLPDLLRVIFKDLPLLELIIDENRQEKREAYIQLGKMLGFNKKRVLLSYERAQKKEEFKRETNKDLSGIEILILGHPYIIQDERLNLGLVGWLKKMGIKFVTSDDFFYPALDNFREERDICWFYERPLLYSAKLAAKHRLKGVIIFSGFPCGTSAVVDEIIVKEILRKENIPVLHLIVDEHSSESAFGTRLESFIDLLSFKKR